MNLSIEFYNFQLRFLFIITFPSEAFNGGIETNYHGGTHAGTFSGTCL